MNIGEMLEVLLPQFGIDRENPDIAAADFEMRQIRAVMNEAGNDLAIAGTWRDMVAEDTLNGTQTTWSFPSDVRHINPVIGVFKTDGTMIRHYHGNAWEAAKAANRLGWRYKAAGIEFTSAPPAGTKVRYVKASWINGDKTEITANSDVVRVPQQLFMDSVRVRWLRAKGLPFEADLAEFNANLQITQRYHGVASGDAA